MVAQSSEAPAVVCTSIQGYWFGFPRQPRLFYSFVYLFIPEIHMERKQFVKDTKGNVKKKVIPKGERDEQELTTRSIEHRV